MNDRNLVYSIAYGLLHLKYKFKELKIMYIRKINNRWYYTIEDKDEQGKRKRHERFGGMNGLKKMFVSTASRRRTTAMVR